jgi:formate dehydrogenase gamma subunit
LPYLDRGVGFALALLAAQALVAGEAPPLPQVTRTSASRFPHRIQLLDEKGNPVTPESTVPYSPRLTCTSSRCHNYETIAQGTHSRLSALRAFEPERPPAHVWTLFEARLKEAAPSSPGWRLDATAPLTRGFLPAPGAAFDPKVHLTPFKLASQFGALYPGGDRFEFDSENVDKKKEDQKNYAQRLAEDPTLRAGSSPDYYESPWDKSGVLEKDCLVCHALSGYDPVERAKQIVIARNFKWAATVGAGFGVVEGREEARKVKYNPALFDPEGRVYLEIGKPPDRNCLFCHRRPTQAEATWADCLGADVHSQSGLGCVACHSGGADHVIAGDRRASKPGFETLTCEGCHTSGRLGAPVPQHKGLPRLHLDKIACETCHAGPLPRRTPLALEQPTDPTWGVILSSWRPSGPTVHAPIYAKDKEGKLRMFVRMLPAYYANRTEQGIQPLLPSSEVERLQRISGEIKDDDGDQVAEINTDAEIKAALAALKRGKVKRPVYLVGGRAGEVDEQGELKWEPNALADPVDLPLSHNVRPAPQALGAKSCLDCHSAKAPFFHSLALTRPLGNDGRPEGKPLFERLGKSKSDLRLAGIREGYIMPYGPVAIAAVALLVALHYVLFGPRRYERKLPEELVQRFNWLERLAHFTLLGSFLLLAITGLAIAAGVESLTGVGTKCLHDVASWALIAAGAVAVLVWVRDMIFAKLDIGWLKVLGGYLGYQGHVPAGRFNAGQKLFFWLILLVVACLAATGLVMRAGAPARWLTTAYTLHDLCAYLMILCIMGHAYLGTFANPGTLGSIFNGKVARAWLEHHHPDYKPEDRQQVSQDRP